MSELEFFIEKYPKCNLSYKLCIKIGDIMYSLNIKKYLNNSCILQFVTPYYRNSWSKQHDHFIEKLDGEFILGYTKKNIPIKFFIKNGELFFQYDKKNTECYIEQNLQNINFNNPRYIRIDNYLRDCKTGYGINSISVVRDGYYKGYKGVYKSMVQCVYTVDIPYNICVPIKSQKDDKMNIGDNYIKYDGEIIRKVPNLYHINIDDKIIAFEQHSVRCFIITKVKNNFELGMICKFGIKNDNKMALVIPCDIYCDTQDDFKNIQAMISDKINNNSIKELLNTSEKYLIKTQNIIKQKWFIVDNSEYKGSYGDLVYKTEKHYVLQCYHKVTGDMNNIEFIDSRNCIGSDVYIRSESKTYTGKVSKIKGPFINVTGLSACLRSCTAKVIHVDNIFVHDILLKNGKTFHIIQVIDETTFLGYEWCDLSNIKKITQKDIEKIYYNQNVYKKMVYDTDHYLNKILSGPDGGFNNDQNEHIKKYSENVCIIKIDIDKQKLKQLFERLKSNLIRI